MHRTLLWSYAPPTETVHFGWIGPSPYFGVGVYFL